MTVRGVKWALVAVFTAILVLSARFVFLTKPAAIWIQAHLGYYLVLVALAWMLWNAWRSLRNVPWAQKAKEHRCALLVVFACSCLLHVHEPHRLRVVYDEPSHLAGSLMMHEERMAVMPGKAHWFYGDVLYQNNYPSFRLYLFQVLLSLVHDVTGYRVGNVYALNGALTLALLLLLYGAGNSYGGKRGGILAVVLFTSVPLLSQNVTSGGYDVLNLVMMLVLLGATTRYLRSPGSVGLDLMVSSAVVLALARYESIVYLLVPLAAAAAKWRLEKQVTLTLPAVFSPLLVLPNLVANLIMVKTDVFMLTHLRQGKVDFFNIDYLPGNLSDALRYLFSVDTNGTNSPLLSAVGAISLTALFVFALIRSVGKGRSFPAQSTLLAGVSILTVGLYAMTLSNFWGMPSDPMAARFTLPLCLVFTLATVWFVADSSPKRSAPGWAIGGAALFVVFYTIPANAKHTATDTMVVSRSDEWFLEYAKSRPRGEVLFVSQSVLSTAIHQLPSISIDMLNKAPDKALRALELGMYKEIIVHEVYWIDPRDGSLKTNLTTKIADKFLLEEIDRTKFIPGQISLIRRFTGYRNDDGTILRPGSAGRGDQFKGAPAMDDRELLQSLP